MLMSNSPDISIWKMGLSGRDMVTNERLDYGIDALGALRRISILAVATATAAVLFGATGKSLSSLGWSGRNSPAGFTGACHSATS
jgi:hypothetical protein